MKKLLLLCVASLALLAGCANTAYYQSVDKANEARIALASTEIKAKAADALADEAAFNALAGATKSTDPVTSAVAAAQLGTALAVRSVVRSQSEKRGTSAEVIKNPEKPVDPVERFERLLISGAQVALGFRAIDKQSDVAIAAINADRDRAIAHDATIAEIAGNVVGVTNSLSGPLSRPGTVVTADRGANVNVGGSQSTSRTDTQTVTCTTGPAGSGGTGAGTGTTAQPGGTGGAAGSNNCDASKTGK